MSETSATGTTFITVGTASTVVRGANRSRNRLVLVNDHATAVIYVQPTLTEGVSTAAVVGSGIRLGPLTPPFELVAFSGEVTAISTVAASNMTVCEY